MDQIVCRTLLFSGRRFTLCLALFVFGLQFLEFVQDIRSWLVAALMFFHSHDELQKLRDRGDNILDMLSAFELTSEVFDADLGNTAGGFLGHLVEDPPESRVTDR